MKIILLSMLSLLFNTDYSYESISPKISNTENIPTNIVESFNNMGVNNSDTLNEAEIQYLEALFGKPSGDFDYSNKKIGFVQSWTKVDKNEYFEDVKHHYNQNIFVQVGLLILPDDLKEKSGGYDAVVIFWSKLKIPDKKLIQSLLKK